MFTHRRSSAPPQISSTGESSRRPITSASNNDFALPRSSQVGLELQGHSVVSGISNISEQYSMDQHHHHHSNSSGGRNRSASVGVPGSSHSYFHSHARAPPAKAPNNSDRTLPSQVQALKKIKESKEKSMQSPGRSSSISNPVPPPKVRNYALGADS